MKTCEDCGSAIYEHGCTWCNEHEYIRNQESPEFRREYQQAPPEPNERYGLYVRAWTAYHQAARAVDGHILAPSAKLKAEAVDAGFRAMGKIIPEYVRPRSSDSDWQSAKREALRRLEDK